MRHATLAALSVAAVLAACGGNDFQASPPATSQVPDSASQSIDGFIAYLKDLVSSAADMLEPVDTSNVSPKVDETSDPQKID